MNTPIGTGVPHDAEFARKQVFLPSVLLIPGFDFLELLQRCVGADRVVFASFIEEPSAGPRCVPVPLC